MLSSALRFVLLEWQCLTTFCVLCRTISRGDIGFEPAATVFAGSTLFCATTKQVLAYYAKRESVCPSLLQQ